MNDFNDRPLSTRIVYGPYYGRANNQIEPNRAMLEVSHTFKGTVIIISLKHGLKLIIFEV